MIASYILHLHVGQEKHLLDLVDVNLSLVAAVPAFGRYLQYKVNFKDDVAVAVTSIDEIFAFASRTS